MSAWRSSSTGAATRNRYDSVEIMLSESQERMLLVAQKGRENEVFRVFQKWGLDAVKSAE